MPSCGRNDAVAASDRNQKGMTKISAHCDQSTSTDGLRLAGNQNTKVIRWKMLETVPCSTKIVQKINVMIVQFFAEHFGIDYPGKIGRAHAVIDHRACDSETRSRHPLIAKMRSRLPGK